LNGNLGFVLTQSLFKSKGGGDGFRRFAYSTSEYKVVLRPCVVHDLSDFNVFLGAINRTSVLIVRKQKKGFEFPIPYVQWRPLRTVDIADDASLPHVMSETNRQVLEAIPSSLDRLTSPWLTLPGHVIPAIQKVRGINAYRAFTGVYTGGLNGAYWLTITVKDRGYVVYQNMADVGKKTVDTVASQLEQSLVYPLIRGRDLHRWISQSSAFILIPYDKKENDWIPEGTLKKIAPNAYSFLLKFRKQLLERKTAIVRQAMKRGPFYSMVAVARYTFAPYKVIYKRLSNSLQAAVIGDDFIPHEKIVLIPATSKEEAHYVAAVLNSSPANLLLRGAAVRVQTIEYAPSDVAQLAVKAFDVKNPVHKHLAHLSIECHTHAEDTVRVRKIEKEIDNTVGKLWGLSGKELAGVIEVLKELEAVHGDVGGIDEDD
jgi:hypothetical protein